MDDAVGVSYESGQWGLVAVGEHSDPIEGEGREGFVMLHGLIVMGGSDIRMTCWFRAGAAHGREMCR